MSESFSSLGLSFPICTMGWGVGLVVFPWLSLASLQPRLYSSLPESGLQSSSGPTPAPHPISFLLCGRQEFPGEPRSGLPYRPEPGPRGETEADSCHAMALVQRATPRWVLGPAPPTTIVTPACGVCLEPGSEQGRASPSGSGQWEGEAQRCAQTGLRSHSGQGELGLCFPHLKSGHKTCLHPIEPQCLKPGLCYGTAL